MCQKVFNERLAAHGIEPDTKSEGAGQLLYLPNHLGDYYETRSARTGQCFDPMTTWADRIAKKRQELEAAATDLQRRRDEAKKRKEARSHLGDSSPISAFNAAFSVGDILIQAGYDQDGNRDCYRHPRSETGSFSASVKDERVYTLSSADPLYTDGNGAHDAFSAFCVLFHGGDQSKAIKDAGDNWLTINGEPWNKVKRREYMERKELERSKVDVSEFINGLSKVETMPTPAPEPESTVDEIDLLARNLMDLSGIEDEGPASLPHIVDKWIPEDEVTLLAGHGGGGKSYASLVMAVHVAIGLPFGSLETKQTNVLFFSGEDGVSVLRHRLRKICQAMRLGAEQLQGKLFLLDASDIDPALHREQKVTIDGRQHIETETRLLDTVTGLVKRLNVGFVVIDNASDAYDDDEIKRPRVRAFIRSLRARIARPGRAVLLLAHINKASASNGAAAGKEDYSGSTAWHNSVRSRLSLTSDGEGAMKIEHMKANLGEKADPVRMQWREGVPMVCGGAHDHFSQQAARMAQQAEQERNINDKNTIVSIIRSFDKRGELVTTSVHGSYTVFKSLKTHDDFPKNTNADRLTKLLRELESEGAIRRTTVRTPARKHKEIFTCSAPKDESAPNAEADDELAIEGII